jgi:multicomponent Na+:H+ antiporter subunit B
MTGLWFSVPIGPDAGFYVGTPLLFDIGVYLAVLGVISTIVFPLVEEK